ncbi:vomeronasal type-2 receptor 116-like [Ctenodactylus gundi]
MSSVVTTIFLLQLAFSVCDSGDEDCLLRRGSSVHKEGDVVIGAFFTLSSFFYFTADSEPAVPLTPLHTPRSAATHGVRVGHYSSHQTGFCCAGLRHQHAERTSQEGGKLKADLAARRIGQILVGAAAFGGISFIFGACVSDTTAPSGREAVANEGGIGRLSTDRDLLWREFGLMPNNYQHVLALVFAIEEINRNPQLLPNVTLGYEFHNALHSYWRTLESSLLLLTGQDEIPNYTCRRESTSVAVLTGASWENAAQFGTLLELYRLPQFVFGSFNPRLSDKGQFPSLYQMAPKDTVLALGMVSMMLHFGWTWVGLVIAEGQKGLQFLSDTVNPSRYPEDNFLALYWFKSFGCSLPDSDCALRDCALNASLTWLSMNRFDPAMSDGSYNIYNAVYAVAHALQEMLRQQVQTQPGGKGDVVVFFPWQTPRSVCSESCGPGFRKTLQEGKAPCCFDCTRCPENEVANDTDTEQCVRCPDHQYANTRHSRCLDKSVTFLDYEDPLGKALAATALSLTVLTAGVLGLFVKHRDTPIVKANNRGLSYTLLVSLAFCFLCSLLFIGRPNTATCVLRQTTFGAVFTVAVSTVLAKTVTVVLAFKVTAPGRKVRRLLVSGAPNSFIPICSLIQLTLCGIWMGTSPPFIDTDAHSEHGHIIIVCNKGSLTAFYCVLGYLGSLALGSFTVAFLARNLPDTFNEAKYLTFSMLVFCSVWVTFLPVYHSTQGKVMVAMEVFSILASGAGLLGCIFAPKCYIILLRPERNSARG